jgi:hypothetical protein
VLHLKGEVLIFAYNRGDSRSVLQFERPVPAE